ncbi:hypothetical protein IW262DRAFT_1366964 [Armillaria fumosa]|nr:hypothetical protein IW262DRAFT_1366964 [Armillaria fumosa]
MNATVLCMTCLTWCHRSVNLSYFQTHLMRQHLVHLDSHTTTVCPVPSCGTHDFSLFDLATHLVTFHCLPVAGTLQSSHLNILRLPVLDQGGTRLDFVPAHNSAVPLKRKNEDSTEDEHPGISPSNHKYYCTGCGNRLRNIKRHLIFSLDSNCRKRHQFYQLGTDGTRIGERYSFDFPADTSVQESGLSEWILTTSL